MYNVLSLVFWNFVVTPKSKKFSKRRDSVAFVRVVDFNDFYISIWIYSVLQRPEELLFSDTKYKSLFISGDKKIRMGPGPTQHSLLHSSATGLFSTLLRIFTGFLTHQTANTTGFVITNSLKLINLKK